MITACVALLYHFPAAGQGPNARVDYIQNKGQWPEVVRYKAGSGEAALFLLKDGLRWSVLEPGILERVHERRSEPWTMDADPVVHGHAWGISFVGGDPEARIVSAEERSHYYNYFIGPDASKWAGHVPAFSSIVYEDVWPGVDLLWHSERGHVKYDVLLNPAADLSSVALAYEGMDGLSLNARGDLEVRTSVSTVIEQHPTAWYADNGEALSCRYVLSGDTLRLELPEGRDSNRAVVIDPVVYASTYSGTEGNGNTYGFCAAYDHFGNIYGGGEAHNNDFPNTSGAFQTSFAGMEDLAINKFNPDGSELIWATYIGGPYDETPISIIVNGAQQVSVLGITTGAGYPTTASAFQPAFGGGSADMVITRLDATGSDLVGSTYLGGSDKDGLGSYLEIMVNYEWHRGEIIFDADDNMWAACVSRSDDFPVTPGAFQPVLGGAQDAVVVCLTPTCDALLQSTFLGGDTLEIATALQFTATGDLLVGGSTMGGDFPMPVGGFQDSYQGGAHDGYVIRFTNGVSDIAGGTFFGTDGKDAVYALDQDPSGDIFLLGKSDSTFAIEPPGTYGQPGGRVFIAKLDPMLSTNPLTTTLGPSTESSWFTPSAFKVDDCDRVNFTGFRASAGFPCTSDSLHGYAPGDYQFYFAAFEPDMADLLFGSYYGSDHTDGGMSRFDDNGILYQAICCFGDVLPATPWAHDTINDFDFDLGLVRMALVDDLCDLSSSLPETGPHHYRPVVYPSPASVVVNVDLGGIGVGPWRMVVRDATGRTVIAGTLAGSSPVDIQHLVSGAYTIEITSTSGASGQVRFVKE